MLTVSPVRSSLLPRLPDRFVLLVDDHEPTLQSLRQVVERAGHPCVATVCSSEAQGYCLGRKPSVLVTDLAMPRMDGHALGLWVKDRYPSVPLVLVTGELLCPDRLDRLYETFTAVIAKPLQIHPFLELLNRVMPSREV
jgi:CheY-like chemotaxis protein